MRGCGVRAWVCVGVRGMPCAWLYVGVLGCARVRVCVGNARGCVCSGRAWVCVGVRGLCTCVGVRECEGVRGCARVCVGVRGCA